MRIAKHQPLTSIFHPRKEFPEIIAARLLRCISILSAHNLIEYRSAAKRGNANGLSRLRLPTTADEDEDYAECFYSNSFKAFPLQQNESAEKHVRQNLVSVILHLF